MIAESIITALLVLIGYYLGSKKPTIQDTVEDIKNIVLKPPLTDSGVGVVKKLSAQEIRYKNSPQREEDEKMVETLDKIFIDE